MKFKILLTLLFINLVGGGLQAGWYECYNFTGFIDKHPITLSMQVREGYFGEASKKDFNVVGVYKYNNYNHPIRLEGKLKDNKAVLFEIIDEKYSASFEFDFSKKECTGVWTNLGNDKTLPLNLSYLSSLVDTSDDEVFNDVDILQINSLPKYYFVGVYNYEPDRYGRAYMSKLKIINKKTNKLFQTIDFANVEDLAGSLKTIIFTNVDTGSDSQIWVESDLGRMGGMYVIDYDVNTAKFVLNTKPIVPGY